MKATSLQQWMFAIAFILFIKSGNSKNSRHFFATDPSDVISYRLPSDTYPEHYDIEIRLRPPIFYGKVSINIVVVNSTKKIVLHSDYMHYTKASIVNLSTNKSDILYCDQEFEREFLKLTSRNGIVFEAGTKWKLQLSYNSMSSTYDEGFYFSSHVDEYGEDRDFALTKFEPIYARQAFPCYDEPDIRANFTITIKHTPKFTAISNMPINEEKSTARKTVFLTTAKIPTYLVGFALGEFNYTEEIIDNIRHRIYFRSNRGDNHRFIRNNWKLFKNYFTEYFGIEYMLPKFDHVAVDKYSTTTTANWGLANHPEQDFLYTDNTSIGSQLRLAKGIASSIGSHWLEGYVTFPWWNNLWVKEGLKTLCSYKAVEKVFPEWNIWEQFYVTHYLFALDFDAHKGSKPMAVYVEIPEYIEKLYYSLSPIKSAAVLRMWQTALGEEVFQRALQSCLKNNAYSTATEEELFTELEKSAKIENIELPASISEMIKTWSQQGGFPIVTVTRHDDNGTFTVKQEAFFNDETWKEQKTWYIPINFAVASKPDFNDTKASHYLANTMEKNIDAQLARDDWIILNKRSEYFYRIIYDNKNYRLITKALIERPFEISVRNRAQLLDDAIHLTFSNRLKHEVLIKMMTYLQHEDQYAPWRIVRNFIDECYRLKNNTNFQNFIRNLVSPSFKRLGVNDISGEPVINKYARIHVVNIACEFGLQKCLSETNKQLKSHILKNKTFEYELPKATLSNDGVQVGKNEFDFFFQMLRRSSEKAESENLIRFLSFSPNITQIKQLISISIDGTLERFIGETVLEKVSSKGTKYLLACIEFLNENWEDYGKLHDLSKTICDVAKYVWITDAERELLALVATVKGTEYGSDTLEVDVRERIRENKEWLSKHGIPILESLDLINTYIV